MNKIRRFIAHPALKILLALTVLGLLVTALSAAFNRVVTAGEQILLPLLVSPPTTLAVYFLLATIATVIVPLPTLPVDVLLMNIFDPWVVLLVRLGAALAGYSINFSLARRFGEPLLRRLFSPANFQQIMAISERVSLWQYFLIAFFPLVNTELVAYAAGLSKLRLAKLLPLLAMAMFYRLLLVLAFVRW